MRTSSSMSGCVTWLGRFEMRTTVIFLTGIAARGRAAAAAATFLHKLSAVTSYNPLQLSSDEFRLLVFKPGTTKATGTCIQLACRSRRLCSAELHKFLRKRHSHGECLLVQAHAPTCLLPCKQIHTGQAVSPRPSRPCPFHFEAVVVPCRCVDVPPWRSLLTSVYATDTLLTSTPRLHKTTCHILHEVSKVRTCVPDCPPRHHTP
jgi:hypothetical protein